MLIYDYYFVFRSYWYRGSKFSSSMKAGEHNTRGGGSKSIPSLGRNIISLDKVLADLNLTVRKSEYV